MARANKPTRKKFKLEHQDGVSGYLKREATMLNAKFIGVAGAKGNSTRANDIRKAKRAANESK